MRKIGPFVIGIASKSDTASARIDRMKSLGDQIVSAIRGKRFDPQAVNERIEEYRLLRERLFPLAQLNDHVGFAMWLEECARRCDEKRKLIAHKIVTGDKSYEWDAIEVKVIEEFCLGIPRAAAEQVNEAAVNIQRELDALHASNTKERK